MIMREREREALERDRLERLHQEQQRPVQSHAGSIPIHQPVANKVQNSIHGPNGLLANGGAGAIQQNGPGPSVNSGLFGGAGQHESSRQPQYLHQPPPAPAPQSSQTFMPGPSPMTAPAQIGTWPATNLERCLELSRPSEGSIQRPARCLQQVSRHHERFQKSGH